MTAPRQLAFDLPHVPAFGREGFFVSPANALALATVTADDGWPQGKLLLLGPEGAGKTHLARIWAEEAGARVIPATALSGADLPGLGPRVVVEDAETLAGLPRAETALFHLHNLILAGSGRLLLTARSAPRDWGLGLPDLLSRLQATAIARLDAPDDALLSAVLVKLFADRQITVPPALIAFLLARAERSLAAAQRLVAALDARALAEGRPVSRAMAAELLDSLPPG